MNIQRAWAMPNCCTFGIKPICELVSRWVGCKRNGLIIDPFAGNSGIANVTNDLDPACDTDYHLEALDFLRLFGDESIGMVLFDPPYSPRQVAEVYRKLGKSVNMQTTQSVYWSNLKKEIARITHWGSVVISCAWNSGGIGKCNGFDIVEILLVAHGGWHNDTIVTVEQKSRPLRRM